MLWVLLSRDYKVSLVESKGVRAGKWGSMSLSHMNRLTNVVAVSSHRRTGVSTP